MAFLGGATEIFLRSPYLLPELGSTRKWTKAQRLLPASLLMLSRQMAFRFAVYLGRLVLPALGMAGLLLPLGMGVHLSGCMSPVPRPQLPMHQPC